MQSTRIRPQALAAASVLACSLALAAPAAVNAQAPVAGAPASFADIVERVAPAVVSIDVRRPGQARPSLQDLFPGFPFLLPPGVVPRQGQPDDAPPPEARASGSGFFISADGHIVTNNHVVENATSISVTLNDGRELPARLVGRDPLTDLAVLKVEGSGFPFVSFSTQAEPRVGDWVIAVGNPFGLGGTATSGIVSAYGRNIGETYVDYLQIDAAINRGNSGGPTFDVYGRVIGVNTAIFSPSGGSIGIGFAIPASVADRITRQLIANGSITRGYLGAQIQNLTEEIAASLGIEGETGALVAEVTPDGPAAGSGLQAGDVVLALNGNELESATDLTRRVAQARPGETLALRVLRDGRAMEIRVRAGTRPLDAGSPVAPVAERDAVLGMMLGPIDETARRRFQLRPGQTGAVIERVVPGGEAAQKGLRAGDVVERAAGRAVRSAADVTEAAEEARRLGRPSILLRISRRGQNLFIALELPPRD